LNEEKAKRAGLAQQNRFHPAFLHSLLPTAAPRFSLVLTLRPGELLLVVSHVFAVPVLVFWVGLEKSE